MGGQFLQSEPMLRRAVQIAYAVADVGNAAAEFAASMGAGPFFIARHIPVQSARVHGVPGQFDHSSAYGQWGDVMVELVVEHTVAIVAPGTGVHHVAFMVPSLPAAVAWCVAQDWPEVLWAELAGGLQFAFCDARPQLGHLIEIYEPSVKLLDFYAMVAGAAKGWDGTDPVRELG